MAFMIAITTLIIDFIGMKRSAGAGGNSTNSSLWEIEDLDLALETQVSRIFDGRDSSSSSAADQHLPCTDQLEVILWKRLSVAVDQSDFPTILRFVKFLKPPEEGLYVDNTSTRSRKHLEDILRKKLSGAVNRWDHPTILFLVKLFKPLGLEEEGLKVFLSYLKHVVSTRSRDGLEKLDERLDSRSQVYFVACLKNLLVDIVSAIEQNDEIVRYLCGEDGIARAISELQEECDSGFTYILNVLSSKLEELASEYHLYSCSLWWPGDFEIEEPESLLGAFEIEEPESLLGAFGIGEPLPELGEIEFYLEEMLLMTQLREDHMDTMSSKIRSLMLVDPHLGRLAMEVVRPKDISNLFLSTFISDYVPLECLIMEKNVRKAIQIDECMPDCCISSMVDDVFYVLWKSCSRALFMSNILFVIPVFCYSETLLKSVYGDALKSNFKKNIELQQIALAFNNLEVSNKNALDLCHRIEEQCGQACPTPDESETDKGWGRRKSRTRYAGSLDRIRHHFEDRLGDGIRQLADLVESQINTIFESFARGLDGEAIYDDANPPWVQMVIDVLETNVASLEPVISTWNYDKIVNAVIRFIVKWLRDNIFLLNFRNGGHEQLPRDIIIMASYLSSITPEWPIEDPVGIQMILLDATVIPRIETILESVKTIDSDGEALYDESNPWIQRLVKALLINVEWLEPLTTAANYDTFVYSVILFIVTWLLDSIFTLRFNESGHKQLLRDMSMLSTHLSYLARRSIENVLDVIMEKMAAIVTLQIEPVLESARTIGSDYPAIYEDEPSPWLQQLTDALETNVAWLQPLMPPTSYDTFAYLVIDFAVTRLERIVISLEFNEGVRKQLPRDMEKLATHLSRMTFIPMQSQFSTLKHLASYGTYKPVMLRWPTE